MRKKKHDNREVLPDQVREDVLKFLYQKYKKSRGVKSQAASISEVKKALKPNGYTAQQIAGALSFLIDRGWVKEIKEKTKFFIKNKLTEGEKTKYRISDVGIVHFEGPSKFISADRFSGINITNIQGVTVVGNNNIVRTEYVDLFNALEELGEAIRSSSELSDVEKADLQNDIETIKDQLGKSEPHKLIIKTAWKNIELKLSRFSEFIDKISKVISLIKIFIG